MKTSQVVSIKQYFANLQDPRKSRRRVHRLMDIVVIAICGVIADCDNWQEIELFAHKRQDWLRRFLALPHGIPSHDTFERVFDRLNPRTFSACFREWVCALSAAVKLPHIAIDGKTLRRSFDHSKNLGPLHLVSAWATEQKLSLGQVAVEAKSNEITAIPQLLELLDVHGALVTIDAMGCQKEIAQKIVSGGGDYVLTVKGNQERLLADIQQVVGEALDNALTEAVVDDFEVEQRGHGRTEKRRYVVAHQTEGIRDRQLWPNLTTVGMCYSEREIDGKTTVEGRYFIGSRKLSAKQYAEVLRDHWGIENSLHWQLDVSFDEDGSRIRHRNGAENFAVLRRMAVSLLKQHPSKRSIACKRKEAILDTAFLEEILAGADKLGNG
jgi:predicted transposase YbfD/YdcC